jgi:protein-tyrosine phosphatase
MLRRIKIRHLKGFPDREETIRTSNKELFWINSFYEGNLAIMVAPRPAESLEDTILGWRSEGIDVVVSLLEPSEAPGLADAETQLCREFGIEFLSFPIRDKTVPADLDAFAGVARLLAERLLSGQGVAIHCRAGIGRSTTMAACVLILLGVDAEVALDMIAEARGIEVPETEAQRQWILEFPVAARRSQS